ncbi:hypothetical protein K440DRAFT_141212 [Wilcoxina mikolae CBS 423.85]|nr:hypothetical protein K440DRAFT_141212 [Wilcoxina mikolae CBS 423.85]
MFGKNNQIRTYKCRAPSCLPHHKYTLSTCPARQPQFHQQLSHSNARFWRRKIRQQRVGIYLRAIVVGILAAGTGRVEARLGGSDFSPRAPVSCFWIVSIIVFFPSDNQVLGSYYGNMDETLYCNADVLYFWHTKVLSRITRTHGSS